MVELPDMSSKKVSVGLPDLPLMPKKKDVTALSGATSSTDGEDESWLTSPFRFLSGTGKAFYNKAVDALGSLSRFSMAGGSMGAGAPSQYLGQEIKGEKTNQATYKERAAAADEILSGFDKIKADIKGKSDVFTDKGMRIPDAEAAGYQIGDGIAQLGLNIFGGGTGLAINYFANTEKNYQEARKQGIPADRALNESAVRAGAETLLDKFLGAERFIGAFAGKQAVKIGTKEALEQLAEKGLGKEAFDKMVSRGIELFSKEGLKTVAKGTAFESADEFFQTYADEGIKTLFDNYQKAKKEDDPTAKIELYNADLGSSKTFVGALNASFYGGLSGGMGARFTGSRAFSPTVYSSLQNAYDAGGTTQLQESAAQIGQGINSALESGKMTAQEHEQALFNLNNIATDVQSYSQNSKADSFTRFSKFEIENSHIPNAVRRVSDTFTDRLSPVVQANESDIKNDIENGNLVTMQFDSRENVPDAFVPYVSNASTQVDGQDVFFANVPASVAQAQEQNTQNKASVLQSITNAITDIANTSNFASFDKLIDRIKMTLPDEKTREAFGLESIAARESVSKDLRLINLMNEAKNDINRNGAFDMDSYNSKLKNWNIANENQEVVFNGNKYTVESVSYDGQKAKLSGLDQEINTSDIAPVVAEEVQPELDKTKQEDGKPTNLPATQGGITENQKGAINDAVSQFFKSKLAESQREGKPSEETGVIPTEEGKPSEGAELTPAKEGKPAKKEKPKGKVYERALEVEDNSPEAAAIKFFAAGGKVMRSTPKNYIGAKLKTLETLFSKSRQGQNIPIKSEMDSRKRISETKEKGGLTIDEIANRLWEQAGTPENISTEDFLAAIEEVITNFQNKTQMSAYLLQKNNVGNKQSLSVEKDFEREQMMFEAQQRGMTLEEFEQYLEDNPTYQEDWNSALEETENYLADIEDNPELLAAFELSESERTDLNNLFAEEAPTETAPEESTTENVGEENNPSQPPVPPIPPTDEQMAGEDENAPLSDQENDLTILSREESKKEAEKLKKEQKTTWESLVEAFVNSDVKIKNILVRAAGKKSFVVSLLRNRRGINASINQTINKANEKIFKGLNEVGMSRFNSLGYALRTIQLDQKRLDKQQKEVDRLTKEFNDKNDKLDETKRKPYDDKVRAEIEAKAKAKFPILNHGTVRIKVNGIERDVPMTSQIALETIDGIKKGLGDEAFAKMSARVDEYKEFGNATLKESYDAGMISKEVYDDLKDDFYSLRATVERTFEQFSPSERIMYQSAVDKAFGSLSKDGTTKVMITDTPLLMQTSYNIMKRAIKKNELKKAMFDATVAQGKESEYFKEAQVETYIDEEGNEAIRQNEKGDVVVKNTPKGFTLVGYKDGGRAKYFFMEDSLNNKMYNLNNTFDSDAIQSKFIMNMVNAENLGNRVLTGFATRYNPLFFITNTQMDMAQQIIFTDIWDGGKTYSNLASSTMRALVRSAKFIDIRGKNKEMIEKTLERATELGLMMDMLSTSAETRKMYKETGEVGPMEQIQPDGKLKKAAKYISKLNLKTEVAMRLAAFTEVQSNLNKDFEKENNRKPNEREQYEIDTIAVAQARAYTDFAEKGTYTPKLNMPYLTSSISAFSSAMEYVSGNKKQFAFKVAQIASSGFVGQLAAMSVMGLFGDPEDWDNVKDYDKDRNILIPYAYSTVKDKFGNDKLKWFFIPIRVNPTIAPVWIASRKAAEETYYKMHGIERKETSGLDKLDAAISAINTALPVAIPIGTSLEKVKQNAGLTISRKLWLAAAFKAIVGYDPYRGQDLLSYEDRQGETGAEGLENKNVEYVYKAIGKMTGLSPVRTKAFVETFTTGSHPLVQSAYVITSEVAAIAMNEKSPTIRGDKTLTNIPVMLKGLVGNKVAITSDVDYSYNKELQAKYKESNDLSKKYLTQERELRIKLTDLRKASKDESDFMDKVNKDILPEYQKKEDLVGQIDVLKTAQMIATKSIKKDALSLDKYDEASIIKVTQTPKAQAEMLYYMIGNNKEKATSTIANASILGVSSEDAALILLEYNKLANPKKKVEEKESPQARFSPPLNTISNAPTNSISTVAVEEALKVTNKVAGQIANIYNNAEGKFKEAGETIDSKLNYIKNNLNNNPYVQDVKNVIDNPDLVFAAYQRWKDKNDESGTTKSKIVLPKKLEPSALKEFSLTGGKVAVGSDTTNLGNLRLSNSDYYTSSAIIDLNKANVGYRNRGDYREGQTNLQAQFLFPFESPKDLPANKMYVGIKNGKMITGNGAEMKGADVVSYTPFAQVTEITNEYANIQNYKYPMFKKLGGDEQEARLNISLSKDGKDNVNNRFAGGATLLETPDKKQKYIVRGSLEQVKSAFNELKSNTNSKYLNVYILDNGSYSTGLTTPDSKSSTEELKAYEAKNVAGSHSIFLK
jgi:hypothetical protein